MSILRRKFFQMLGLGAAAIPGLHKPPNSLYHGKEVELAQEAYEQLLPQIHERGIPDHIIVGWIDPPGLSTVKAFWRHPRLPYPTLSSFAIDFGNLVDNNGNYHYRLMIRVADILSERIGCKIGYCVP